MRRPGPKQLDELLELARALGADAAAVVDNSDIVIDSKLAALCKQTRCPNYGLSPTCPPHVEGPAWLAAYLPKTPKAIFLKIEMSRDQMYSEQRLEIGKLLHFIVIELERAAKEMGFSLSRGFAGGSCKELFCHEYYSCEVLEGNGTCRNPDSARPSVSGYGINTNHLLTVAGPQFAAKGTDKEITTSRYGLILIG